jgi:hypothetical protein
VWRWAAGVWTALVVTGGALTLWLQDANEPRPPVRWEDAPTPSLSADVREMPCPTRVPVSQPRLVICVHESR